jgi:hypothetical protein
MPGTVAFWSAAAWILLSSAVSAAQPSSVSPQVSSYRDPVELVRKVVQNEIKVSKEPSEHFMFRGTKTIPKGSTTRIYVEANEATAGMVIAYDGKPLTDSQRRAEQARLERFLSNPDELRKKRAQERADADRTLRIMRALPDAFLYEYAGQETGSAEIGRAGDPLVKLRFRPNPDYRPPSRVEEVLRGMRGTMLVDAAQERLASIDGTLFKDVSFGWGILGHLDRGGRFVVHQQAVEGEDWEISSMTLKFTGKVLLVKSLSIDSTEVFSGFKRVPSNLSFAQAIELLKKEAAGGEQNAQAADHARRK